MFEKAGIARFSRLPVSIGILLESVLRHVDGLRMRDEDVEALARWRPDAPRTAEVPFVVGRVLLQDFTGPSPGRPRGDALGGRLAWQGSLARAAADAGGSHLDHSVQVDHFGGPDALRGNMDFGATKSATAFLRGARRRSTG
jgi:aconitate hydratase